VADDTDTLDRLRLPPNYTPVAADSIGKADDYLNNSPHTKASPVDEFLADQKTQLGKLDEAAKEAETGYQRSMNERIAATQRQIADDKAAAARTASLARQMPTAPNAPKLQAAPQQQERSSFQAFQNPAVVFALLGSLLSRGKMTAALNAGAAAMKGFREGDRAAIKQNVENWKLNVEEASKQFQMEMQQYQAAMEKHRGKEAALQAELAAIASAHKDEIALATIQQDGSEGLWNLKKEQFNAHEKMMVAAGNLQDRYEAREERAREAELRRQTQLEVAKQRSVGVTSPQGYDEYVKGIGEGRTGLPKGKYAQQIRQDVFSRYPNFDETEFVRKTAAERLVGGMETRALTYSNEVETASGLALEASAAFPRGRFVPLNKIRQMIAEQTSSPEYNDFLTKNMTLAKAYGRAMNPQGLPRVSENAEAKAEGLLSKAISKEAYQTQVRALLQEIATVKKAIAKTKQELKSGVFAPDDEQSVINSFNRNMTAPDATPGAPPVGTVKDGYRFKGGDHRDKNNWELAVPSGGST